MVGAAGTLHAFELRTRHGVERPTFWTDLAGCRVRAVERTLALAAIEARHMTARERRPHHAVGREIDAARAEGAGILRGQIEFSERGLRRIGTRHDANDVAGLLEAREPDVHRLAPDRIIDRARLHAVQSGEDALVLGGIDQI